MTKNNIIHQYIRKREMLVQQQGQLQIHHCKSCSTCTKNNSNRECEGCAVFTQLQRIGEELLNISNERREHKRGGNNYAMSTTKSRTTKNKEIDKKASSTNAPETESKEQKILTEEELSQLVLAVGDLTKERDELKVANEQFEQAIQELQENDSVIRFEYEATLDALERANDKIQQLELQLKEMQAVHLSKNRLTKVCSLLMQELEMANEIS